ncbi:hypothetical protein [Maribacter sp. ACAM166]|uniref:hypothetical protein n=1 Tax=Maribacter sp. ACAM166 TaxID=2508996 RepID=UPI0010FCEF80|nr:hypothetical protein [Maribacter sp. ACAM166]TLP80409.1 hypothetical protein ES765_08065 [Maribacter sp. ACAM166]
MKKKFSFLALLIWLGFAYTVNAQADCALGVGVTNDTIIFNVFQLNSLQKEKLINYGAELKYRNDLLNNELQNITDRHPQSTVTELTQLADKYKNVMDSMGRVQMMIDKRMLASFNPKQYELYRSLCKEASRSPFIVTPTVYPDSLNNKN